MLSKLILYFPLRLASSFSWRAATYEKRDDEYWPKRKVVSSPQEKIWKYFRINKHLFTLKKKRERQKRATVHTLWRLQLYNKHIHCVMLLPLSSRKNFTKRGDPVESVRSFVFSTRINRNNYFFLKNSCPLNFDRKHLDCICSHRKSWNH